VSDPPAVDRADHEEYDYYLGIFVFLGLVLITTTLWYNRLYRGFPYEIYAWVAVGLAIAVPVAFSRKYHLMSDRKSSIPLAHKKSMLIVAFAFYMVGAALLTMWGGGRQSAASNLLVLTSGLSVYVAKERLTKIIVGAIAMAFYAGTSMYWFDVARGMTAVSPWDASVWFDFALVLVTMFVAGHTSGVIAERQKASGGSPQPQNPT